MTVPGKSSLTSAERTRQVARVLWVTLVLNWSTALLKIALGFWTQCMVVVADGFHSLSDGTSNIIGLVGIALSGHPADEDHPYGHQKYETLASIAIAVLLFLVSFGILQRAFRSFWQPMDPQVPSVSFWVMGATLLVNLFIVWYERTSAERLHSELLHSDSWHTLTDVFVTLGVFVAMIGIRWHLPIVDPIFSIGIGVMIALVAFRILKQSSDILCDKAVLDAAKVVAIAKRVPGVQDCHEVRSRGRLHGVYVDLHILVDPVMSVADSHRLANTIEHDIKKEIPGVQDVVVHIEPTTHDHEELTDND